MLLRDPSYLLNGSNNSIKDSQMEPLVSLKDLQMEPQYSSEDTKKPQFKENERTESPSFGTYSKIYNMCSTLCNKFGLYLLKDWKFVMYTVSNY